MVSGNLSAVNDTSWAEYVRAITGNDSGKAVALKLGQSESAISRWKSGGTVPDPRQVVAFARAYDRSPLEALIVAGYLTESEASVSLAPPRALAIRDFSDLELAAEIVRRADTGGILDQPLDADHPAMRPHEPDGA